MAAVQMNRLHPCPAPSRLHLRARTSARASSKAATSSAKGTSENAVTRIAVSALTEGLKLAGVGSREYAATSASERAVPQLRRGDVAGLMRELRADYRRQYFVTGLVSDAIYADDCVFADPTISFRGREQYKRNLELLVPFLLDPSIQLYSLRRLPSPAPGTPTQLCAAWRLRCWLRLPWAPLVDIRGSTTYTLNTDRNQIVSHVEEWEISAGQALLLLLQPSDRAVWRRRRSGS